MQIGRSRTARQYWRPFLLVLTVALMGCATINGYEQFYTAYFDPFDPSVADHLEVLKEGEEPEIYSTDNFDRDVAWLRSQLYEVVGYSSFNGAYQNIDNVRTQARNVGASVALVGSTFTETRTTTSSLVLPDTSTTYTTGNVNVNTYTPGSGTSYSSGSYRGTSTTYGTRVVPYTTSVDRYDQNAVFFVKLIEDDRLLGVLFAPLDPTTRSELGRNIGVIVDVVYEGYPAFYANLIPGDVVISIDGNEVRDREHSHQILNQSFKDSSEVHISFIRNGETQETTIVMPD